MAVSDPKVDNSPKPVDIITYKTTTLIDTIFFSKQRKKPCWITSTSGPTTTLFSVSPSGQLLPVAVIQWTSTSSNESKKSDVMVEMNGDTFTADKFGRKPGNANSRTCTIMDIQCTWSCIMPDSDPENAIFQVIRPYWECTTTRPGSPATSSNSTFRSFFKRTKSMDTKVLLARFRPFRTGMKTDLSCSLYPDGVPYAPLLLLSFILIDTKKDDWKKVQSKVSPQQLETILARDAVGDLPTYSTVGAEEASDINLHVAVPASGSRWRWDTLPAHNEAEENNNTAPPYTA
ncbi:hypothetical protein CPB86DRAFT_795226 [Serendipita vermifera]|nr:hypothetical protein CPB86DRAFT_795226 [Serendipita vermifera]